MQGVAPGMVPIIYMGAAILGALVGLVICAYLHVPGTHLHCRALRAYPEYDDLPEVGYREPALEMADDD